MIQRRRGETVRHEASLQRRLTSQLAVGSVLLVLLLALGNAVSYLLRDGLGRPWVVGIVPLLDMVEEESIGTWVTVIVLVLLSVVAVTTGRLVRRAGGQHVRNWNLLGLAFLYVSLDEVATIHEDVSAFLQARFDLQGVFMFAWVVPFLLLTLVFAAVQLRFLLALPRPVALRLVIAGAIYVSGAAGLELVESSIFSAEGEFTLTYRIISAVEEVLELSGLLLALHTLVEHLRKRFSPSVSFTLPRPSQEHRLDRAA